MSSTLQRGYVSSIERVAAYLQVQAEVASTLEGMLDDLEVWEWANERTRLEAELKSKCEEVKALRESEQRLLIKEAELLDDKEKHRKEAAVARDTFVKGLWSLSKEFNAHAVEQKKMDQMAMKLAKLPTLEKELAELQRKNTLLRARLSSGGAVAGGGSGGGGGMPSTPSSSSSAYAVEGSWSSSYALSSSSSSSSSSLSMHASSWSAMTTASAGRQQAPVMEMNRVSSSLPSPSAMSTSSSAVPPPPVVVIVKCTLVSLNNKMLLKMYSYLDGEAVLNTAYLCKSLYRKVNALFGVSTQTLLSEDQREQVTAVGAPASSSSTGGGSSGAALAAGTDIAGGRGDGDGDGGDDKSITAMSSQPSATSTSTSLVTTAVELTPEKVTEVSVRGKGAQQLIAMAGGLLTTVVLRKAAVDDGVAARAAAAAATAADRSNGGGGGGSGGWSSTKGSVDAGVMGGNVVSGVSSGGNGGGGGGAGGGGSGTAGSGQMPAAAVSNANTELVNAISKKLTLTEMKGIVNLMDRQKKLEVQANKLRLEKEDLAARLHGTENVKEFLVQKLKETETALKRSLDEKGASARQNMSDLEVITFLDSKTQEMERAAKEAMDKSLESQKELEDVRLASNKRITMLEDMLRLEQQKQRDSEAQFKKEKKLLVQEVRKLRGVNAAVESEADELRKQLLDLRERLKGIR